MPIISSEVSSLTRHGGSWRARFAFTFTDGRIVTRGPVKVAGPAAAETRRVNMEPNVQTQQERNDAREAVDLLITGAYKEASANRVNNRYITERDALIEERQAINALITEYNARIT